MKILHTSDWHLGRTLYGKKRYAEFEAFLDWLLRAAREERADVLIVAGDVFDNTAPGTKAQQLYYRFLGRLAATGCRHSVVVGGNHDSPSFLDAPRELLSALDVHVVGSPRDDLRDELILLRDKHSTPELLVCAVPYLWERHIRVSEVGESPEDKDRKRVEGIRRHYMEIGRLAEQARAECGRRLPIVATGHLFAAGGQTTEGDGVRDLYVGSLAQVGADCFPQCFDYVALGHLHLPQKVNRSETIRYSGSPLPMGMGEAGQHKNVVAVEFETAGVVVKPLEVPVFQELERIVGDMDDIAARLGELVSSGSRAWVEVVYDGADIVTDLRMRVEKLLSGSDLELLRVRNEQSLEAFLRGLHSLPGALSLEELDEEEVFSRCLELRNVPDQRRPDLWNTYRKAADWGGHGE